LNKQMCWQGSHETAHRGAIRETSEADCAKRDLSWQAAGWTVGWHVLPMHLVDRMESLKVGKVVTLSPGNRRKSKSGTERAAG
jgi:hypothetical protein